MILTMNSDDSYFPIQHLLTGICSECRVFCSMWGKYWSSTKNLSVRICRPKLHRSCCLHRRNNTCKHARSRTHARMHTHEHSIRKFIPPPADHIFLIGIFDVKNSKCWSRWSHGLRLVYGRSLSGIAGSNPSGSTDVRPLRMLCRIGSSLCDGPINRPGSVPSVCVCVCVLWVCVTVWSNATIILFTYNG